LRAPDEAAASFQHLQAQVFGKGGSKRVQQEMIYHLMSEAGVRGGMRVLDIGCGRGDVATLAAQLVGTQGQVVGVDKDENAIEMARDRMRELGLTNVSFALADLGALPGDLGRFNAVVGRRVLVYQPDAAECLTRLADVLVPGGLIVLQEHDSTAMPICHPAMPLHERISAWIWATVAREGATCRWAFISLRRWSGPGSSSSACAPRQPF
jgi:ubiquinone/menaquinone biosynthesis C-methylase UbiE